MFNEAEAQLLRTAFEQWVQEAGILTVRDAEDCAVFAGFAWRAFCAGWLVKSRMQSAATAEGHSVSAASDALQDAFSWLCAKEAA